jgi:acetoin utilization protein AcuB
MDFTAPISKYMTRKLVTVTPSDRMTVVKEIFDTQRIHHIPVVRYTTLVGIISKTDLMHFIKGMNSTPYDQLIEESRLHNYTVEDVMVKGIATLESSERINVALQLFAENLFHAIPIVDNEELVGMLTTFDIIKTLVEEDNVRIKSA